MKEIYLHTWELAQVKKVGDEILRKISQESDWKWNVHKREISLGRIGTKRYWKLEGKSEKLGLAIIAQLSNELNYQYEYKVDWLVERLEFGPLWMTGDSVRDLNKEGIKYHSSKTDGAFDALRNLTDRLNTIAQVLIDETKKRQNEEARRNEERLRRIHAEEAQLLLDALKR